MTTRISYSLIIGLISVSTQAARGQQSGAVRLPAATIAEEPQKRSGAPSESEVATANNPIAPMNAIYFQNYYAPTVYGVPGSDNLLDVRTLVVSGRQIIRATLPISSGEDGNGNQQSGLGDFNLFAASRVSPKKSKDVLAVGPLLVAPNPTNRSLGQGKWQAGWLQLVFTRCRGEAYSSALSWPAVVPTVLGPEFPVSKEDKVKLGCSAPGKELATSKQRRSVSRK